MAMPVCTDSGMLCSRVKRRKYAFYANHAGNRNQPQEGNTMRTAHGGARMTAARA